VPCQRARFLTNSFSCHCPDPDILEPDFGIVILEVYMTSPDRAKALHRLELALGYQQPTPQCGFAQLARTLYNTFTH